MRRMVLQIVAAVGFVVLGWTVGRAAQVSQSDFELHVSSPGGETTITCLRGCGLQFIRSAPDREAAQPSFTYTCGSPAGRCGGAVQGWILPE